MTTVPDSATSDRATCPVHTPGFAGGDFNPFGPHGPDAYAHLATARREQPVFFSAALASWCVTRDADIRAVCTDPATFSSRDVFPRPAGLPPKAQAVMDYHYDNGTVTQLDPPAHGPIRRAMHTSFGPRAISGYDPAVRATIAAKVDAIPHPERFDLVAEFSAIFPVAVVMDVIGVPAEDFADIRRWAEELVAVGLGHRAMTEEQLEALGADLAVAVAYFRELVDRRTADPGSDLVSFMIGDGGPALTPDEVANNIFNLVAAGYETTGSALTNTVLALLREPGAWDALVAGELDPAAVALEGLRFDTPILGNFRTATRDTVLGDARIAAGDRLLLLYGSANHDESVVDEPEAFRPGRPGKAHLAFGYGLHNCVGAPLARLELEVALEQLARRFPKLALAPDTPLTYKPLMQVRTPAALFLTAG